MRRGTLRATCAVVVVAACAGAPAAQAASGVLLGPGDGPGVAVDAAGTVHVAWNAPYVDDVGQPLTYCSWPRGARTCVPRVVLSDRAATQAQPALVNAGPAPGEVTVVSSRDGLQVVRSADGGATFGPPAVFGRGRYFEGAFGPDGRMALSFDNLGFAELRVRSLAGPPTDEAKVGLNHGFPFHTQVAFAGPLPVLVSGAQRPGIAVSSWTGTGDVHDPATWAGPFRIARSNYFGVASGPRGVFLAHQAPHRDTFDRVVVRRLRGQRFGRGRTVPVGRAGAPAIIELGLGQDAAGRLVAVWWNNRGNRLEVSASRDGRRWTAARVLVTGVAMPGRIEVGLGPDGRGAVVWDEDERVRAARLSAPALLKRRPARRRR